MNVIQKLAKFLGKETIEMKDGNLSLSEQEEARLKEFLGEKYDAVIEFAKNEITENDAEAQLKAAAEALGENKKEGKKEGNVDVDVVQAINDLKEKVKTLETSTEDDKGKKVPPPAIVIPINAGLGHTTDKHLFGIEHPIFAMDKPWNQMAAKKQPIGNDWGRHESKFKDEFEGYAKSFADRIAQLQDDGTLGTIKMEDIDFSGFTGTGWGEDYIVRRQDALIAYLRDLPSVTSIFPVRYGVQDKMVMTNSFLTDFSQAYQSGEVWKGKHEVEPELAQVNDVMFKHQFTNLKNLEKEYIGYLNREGSDPMKWSFIEWIMMQTLRKLHNEQEERRVLGYRIEPTTDVAGHHMFGSNGVIRTLYKYTEDFKLLPFDTMSKYTSSTILTFVNALVEAVNGIVPSLRGMRLYMNEKHVPWYLAAYRKEYGTDLDFKGSMLEVKNYSIDGIVPVPNMGNSYLMWITMPGNIELYEDKAGEMAAFYFERRLENLVAASWWKEGSGAYMSGRKYADLAALEASKRKNQYIFLTDPFVELAADATTADGSLDNRFKTVANSGATAITDITNAEEGVVYRIEIGSATNPSNIAKSGKFSEISAAWTPTAVGDYLEVYYRASDGKFIEVRRNVT